MRYLRFALAAAALAASTAFASPTDPKAGAEYVNMSPPQPVQAVGKKVEVIEFFMYHCPHCNVLEPELEAWVKRQGDNINFKRVHFPSTGPLDPEAHLYLTLDAMGKADEFQPKVFNAVHNERIRLNTDDAILAWATRNGLDKAKFTDTWNSFGVLTKLKRLGSIVTAYKVDGAPTLIVDGRFMTSPSLVSAVNPGVNEAVLSKMTTQVLDALVNKAKPAAAGKK